MTKEDKEAGLLEKEGVVGINKKDVYSDLKYVHWLPQLVAARDGKIIPPVNLQIDPTNVCNHDCDFCYYHVHELGNFAMKDTLPVDRVIATLDDLAEMGGKSVEWTGGGEPMVHKDYALMSRRAREHGFQQALVTNGQLLNRNMEEVKDYAWVRFSINGGPSTYAKTHRVRPGVYDKVLDHLSQLARIKDPTNMLGVSYVVTADNWQDIAEVAKEAKARGADNFRISIAHTDAKDAPFIPVWGQILSQIDQAKVLEDKDFRVFSFSNRIAEVGRQKANSGMCYYQNLTTALGADGELYPCCYFKYLPQYALGNIKEQSFVDIWHGDKRKKFIEDTASDCRGSCWMVDKNKLAQYIVADKKDVPHVNFP